VSARINKSAELAARLSEGARAALLSAKFIGGRWVLQTPAAGVTDELRALQLARESNQRVHITILGMKIRAVVVRSKYHHGAVSE
jgi:hypothetical protein